MTDKIKSAIGELERTRDTRVFFPKDISMKLAIRSLQAWEEVLQELENKRDFVGRFIDTERNSGRFDAYNAAINIINQHLAEIK